MGSPCLFTRQRALKMGYFYWLRVKSSNHLHAELNLGYLKGTEFCLEIKASFVDISSIASFKPFLIAWLREYCTFSNRSISQSHSKMQFKSTSHRQSCNYVLRALVLAFVFLLVALECLRLLCYSKVIPLKLFFYQTFFETSRN